MSRNFDVAFYETTSQELESKLKFLREYTIRGKLKPEKVQILINKLLSEINNLD